MPSLGNFVAQGRQRWQRLEELAKALERRGGLEGQEVLELDRLYRQVNTDLAACQSRWPDSDYTRMLELLLMRAHNLLYPSRNPWKEAMGGFFRQRLPLAMSRFRNHLWLSFGVFLLGALLGAAISLVRPDAAELLVGADTLEQLKDGHTWLHGLEDENLISLFGQIYGNNLSISLRAFAAGILLGLGALLMMLYNGFHLGAMLGVCITYGVEQELLTFVVGHGFLELFCIFMAGAAGMAIGFAILAPGRLSRRDAVAKAGQESLPLVLACFPFLLLAALVESFVSPIQAVPVVIKAVMGPLLLVLLLLYMRERLSVMAPAAREGDTHPRV